MPPDRDLAYLWDMLKSARGVSSALQGYSFERYLADENLRLAVERRIEIIGEAARRVSSAFKEQHPEIPWRPMVDQRNFLIHAYDKVADERVWTLAVEEIPRLVEQLSRLVPEPPPDPEEGA